MTLVALLNCTLSSNEAYSSATTSLTFASGSLMVFDAITNASRPLYMGPLSMAHAIQATASVAAATASPVTVSLASYTTPGECHMPFTVTIDGCPRDAQCSVAVHQDTVNSSLCSVSYTQLLTTDTTTGGPALALFLALAVVLLSIGVAIAAGSVFYRRRRRLQKAVTELRGQRRGTYSGSGDWQPRAPGASLLELGDCHEEVRRDDTTRDHSPPNPLKLHLEIDGASKAASPSKGQAPPPTPSQWMKQTESKLKSLGRQWSGKGMDESIRPLVGSYEFGCTRASKAAAVHDGDKELLAGRCNEDLVIGIDDGPSLEGTVVAVVAKGAPPPTPMNKGKEIDLLP
eukprot:CAMPEP_0174384690 /NCGR_PEP_ID=MMETSP0811_2-20130205/126085_1 /TAXON_ID=73025 ORGANISM="Eutreptiella gymnastica-like, Strain CCMP1594" /NCGR_SAMPLE_ID=MMETSP0811_2 /ASSEMBLY_ACC=CAM_ASM_000667 /LENGTH=343 /DNA_ID=CAMNT_0015538729 /DNA_START=9 /DNA_END=1040 /DNA_ORIENTATION=+